MSQKRLTKKIPKIALIYDFDGTLAPGNMQEHSFIPKLNINKEQFWKNVHTLAKENDMNEILAYMQLMLSKAREKNIPITKKAFLEYGQGLKFFPGVEEFFPKINAFGLAQGVQIEHYVISSGLREIISGTTIFKNFTNVFASAYKFDVNQVAEWPAVAIDYTNKTQFLFRINKGINNSWDNSQINKYFKEEDRPLPFSRMIYLGDGETDIPAMKMLRYQGGNAIAVYDPNQRKNKSKLARENCFKLVELGRANYALPANYQMSSPLVRTLKLLIQKLSIELELKK